MKISARIRVISSASVLTLLILAVSGGDLGAKDRSSPTNPNDPTVRLYSLLDSKFNGKLEDFCMLADLVNDPKNSGQQLQRVIRIDYNKDHGFGKLNLHVRTVAPLTPDQLKAYTPKQIYDFAEADACRFTKTDAGSFGRPGDVYFEAPSDGGALTSTAVTQEVQAQYDAYITQYLLPALEKKDANGS